MKKTKKILSVFLALLMVISIIPMSSITASAATAIKTQAEAVAWLNAQQDKTYDYNGADGTQCTEFVKAYVNYLMTGDPWQNCGYAVDYNGRDVWKSSFWKNNGWTVYENTFDFMPQPGDIFCAGLSSYGHTGVVISSDIYTAKIAEANGRDAIVNNGDPVWIRTISWKSSTTDSPYGATHFIRPNFKNTPTNVPTTSVSLNSTSFTLEVGQTKTLTATVTPSNATNKSVTWSSSNTSVATVSSSGVVLAKAGGTCTITATNSGGQKATATVNVTSGSLKICVDGNSNNQYLTLTLGGTESTNCYLSINEYYGNSVEYSYGVSNNNVSCSLGNVDSSKQAPFSVYADLVGETTITISVKDATSGAVLDTINVYVTVNAKPSYTVSFDANGGTGAPSSQTKYHDTALTLSSTIPTRSGYTFLGWSTSSTATSATYQPGASFTSNANTTLYAVWQRNASPTVHTSADTVTLTLGGTESTTIYAWATGVTGSYTVQYQIADTNIVRCAWGDWNSENKSPLTITAKSKGTTTLTISVINFETKEILDSTIVRVIIDANEQVSVDFSIKEPSTTTIRYKDGIALHIDGYIPEGARVEWAVDSNAFDGGIYDNGMSCLLVSKNNGYTTVVATLYDANDNVIATGSIELRSKAGFFDKIGGFFRSLFGATTIYDA